MKPQLLVGATLDASIEQLNLGSSDLWRLNDDGKLEKHFEFDDFNAAWAFMTRVALFAERSDHHPEWKNVYNRVSVELRTHDVGGISSKDLDLARFMNGCLNA
ncbi:MAG: 4a-hydroxytetrahydrobiopterin dehydratase [Congregibacter sp.]|nr:4a-hydroxytetrahydrobiopterin dehydratase [Congregibacter sp.]